jgi:hypothetical protein
MDVRSVENLLGTPVSYAYGVKEGPWLFLSGHEAYDGTRSPGNPFQGPCRGRLENPRTRQCQNLKRPRAACWRRAKLGIAGGMRLLQ